MRIHAEVSSAGFVSQSYGLSLVSNDKDSIYVNDGFTPTEIGTYTADIVGKDDNGYVLTDTLRRTFTVSDYIYARDNGDNVTNFGDMVLMLKDQDNMEMYLIFMQQATCTA